MTTKQLAAFVAILGGFVVASGTAKAQLWDSGQSCQPGSDSIGLYTFDTAGYKFSGSNTGTIKVRCAVPNPKDSGVPSWSTLTVGYTDPDGTGIHYQVNAQLVRVSKSANTSFIIKTFDSSSFLHHHADFTQHNLHAHLRLHQLRLLCHPHCHSQRCESESGSLVCATEVAGGRSKTKAAGF